MHFENDGFRVTSNYVRIGTPTRVSEPSSCVRLDKLQRVRDSASCVRCPRPKQVRLICIGDFDRCELAKTLRDRGRCNRRAPGDASPMWLTASCEPLKTKRYPLGECRGAHRKSESTNAIAAYHKARSWRRESTTPFWGESTGTRMRSAAPFSRQTTLGP
jgi:hypothetical protein